MGRCRVAIVVVLLVVGCIDAKGAGKAPTTQRSYDCSGGPAPQRHAFALRIDADGSVRWRVELYVSDESSQAQPIVADDVVYTTEGQQLRALALDDGRVRWHADLAGDIYDAWLVGGMLVASVDFPSEHGRLVGVDAATGTVRWTLDPDGEDLYAQPILTDDGGIVTQDRAGEVRVVDPADGHVRWAAPGTANVDTHLTVATGTVLREIRGQVVAFESATGKERWSGTIDQLAVLVAFPTVIAAVPNGGPDGSPITAYDVRSGRDLSDPAGAS